MLKILYCKYWKLYEKISFMSSLSWDYHINNLLKLFLKYNYLD